MCAALLVPTGCAKFPSTLNAGTGAQLVVTMTVAGQINPSFYYFVAFNTSNDATGATGPVPVVAAPWGNGFIAGSATHFVEYHSTLPADGYAVYSFVSGSSLQQYTAIGVPTQDTPITTGSNAIQFRIPLSQLIVGAMTAADIHNLQVNFLTMDSIPVDPNNTSFHKIFDGLGDPSAGGLNNYITISTDQATTYSNSIRNIEHSGDVQQTTGSGLYNAVSEPDLDITDWSVQIVR